MDGLGESKSKGRAYKIDEEMKERIFSLWQDRLPTKAIAIEVGLSYTAVYQELKKRYLVG
jgi:hypothetical protein